MGTQVTPTGSPLFNPYILPGEVASQDSKSSDNIPTPHPLNPVECFSSFSVNVTMTKKRKERGEPHKIDYFESLIQANALFYGKRYAVYIQGMKRSLSFDGVIPAECLFLEVRFYQSSFNKLERTSVKIS